MFNSKISQLFVTRECAYFNWTYQRTVWNHVISYKIDMKNAGKSCMVYMFLYQTFCPFINFIL